MDKKPGYKNSLNLPKTDFPMRANLAQREVAQLSEWDAEDLYAKIQKQHADDKTYILHDGPPYANGHIHIGHALNKILKDIIVKSKTMRGLRSPYVPGWDCHGLPIEHQVLKKLGSKKREMSKIEIREKCRESALRFVDIQREEFKRLGIFGEWENPYLTLTPDYEANIVREFGKVVATGGVYKGKKPVLWCAFDETALAEAEVEYADKVSPSIYVKFPIDNPPYEPGSGVGFGMPMPGDIESFSFVIWTTTPWTLPANQGVCLHPDFDYDFVKVDTEVFVVASELVESVANACGWEDFEVLDSKIGDQGFEGLECLHPMNPDKKSQVVLADYVTLEQGTGIVHIAPGHGQEDYQVAEKYNSVEYLKVLPEKLEVFAPVNHWGKFTDEVGDPDLIGKKVFEADPIVIQKLLEKNILLGQGTISHSYPHCWRCKKPVIFRATEQWFISMSENDLRERALKTIAEDVKWIPSWGQDRIEGMITNRPDWCISRQRVWGVPIVAFACLDCDETFVSEKIINHVADRMEQASGSDIWFSESAESLLPKETVCPKCGGKKFKQEQDILDVWFESGVSHAAVLKARKNLAWPADLYLEGSDQHRGWFHSTMLAALMTDNRVPYKSVLTHGFVVDGAGKKMSKSDGNVIAPQEVISKHGADILRLWVAATDFREDIRISPNILTQIVEAYRKIRNTCRYLLGNLNDYPEGDVSLSEDDYQEIDDWARERLYLINEKVQQAYEESTFHVVFHTLNNFCSVDLSAFYLDILKDRLYVSAKNSKERRAAQTVMQEILLTLVRLMAPILSFTAEEIWQHLPPGLKSEPSVHLTNFPKMNPPTKEDGEKKTFLEKWDTLIRIREEVARFLEQERKEKKIGSSLEASVTLFSKKTPLETSTEKGYPFYKLLQEKKTLLPTLFIVSQVKVFPFDEKPEEVPTVTIREMPLGIQIHPARGIKCERCWIFNEDVGSNSSHPSLCLRCAEVIASEEIDES